MELTVTLSSHQRRPLLLILHSWGVSEAYLVTRWGILLHPLIACFACPPPTPHPTPPFLPTCSVLPLKRWGRGAGKLALSDPVIYILLQSYWSSHRFLIFFPKSSMFFFRKQRLLQNSKLYFAFNYKISSSDPPCLSPRYVIFYFGGGRRRRGTF